MASLIVLSPPMFKSHRMYTKTQSEHVSVPVLVCLLAAYCNRLVRTGGPASRCLHVERSFRSLNGESRKCVDDVCSSQHLTCMCAWRFGFKELVVFGTLSCCLPQHRFLCVNGNQPTFKNSVLGGPRLGRPLYSGRPNAWTSLKPHGPATGSPLRVSVPIAPLFKFMKAASAAFDCQFLSLVGCSL